MATIESLVVKIAADAAALEQGLRKATGNVERFVTQTEAKATGLDRTMSRLSDAIVGYFAFDRITAGLGAAFQAADSLTAAQAKLGGAAKQVGQDLDFAQGIAGKVREQFGTSERVANDLSAAMLKLAGRAGDAAQTLPALGNLLNIAAQNGLSAADALDALNLTLLGQDEGLNRLGLANPMQIYEQWAAAAGTTAAKMGDAQKSLAVLTAFQERGSQATGEYTRWMASAAGQTAAFKAKSEDAAASFGRSLEAVRLVALPGLAQIAQGFAKFVGGLQLMGAQAALWAGQVKLAWLKVFDLVPGVDRSAEIAAAEAEVGRLRTAFEEESRDIVRSVEGIMGGGGTAAARAFTLGVGHGLDAVRGHAERLTETLEKVNDALREMAERQKEAMNVRFNLERMEALRDRTVDTRLARVAEPSITKSGLPGALKVDALLSSVTTVQGRFAEAVQSATIGIADLAAALGGLSPALRNALTGLNGIFQGIGQAAGIQGSGAGFGIKGFTGFVSAVGAATAIIGGMIPVIDGLGAALTGASRQIAAVTASLRELRLGAQGFEVSQGGIAKAITAVEALLKISGPQQALQFGSTVAGAGLSTDQLIAIAEAISFPLLNAQGGIQLGLLDEFLEALKLSTQGTNRFADSVNKATAAMINAAPGFRIAGAVWRAQDPRTGWTPPTGPATGDPQAGPGRPNVNITVPVSGGAAPDAKRTYRALWREWQQQARVSPAMLDWFNTLPEPA